MAIPIPQMNQPSSHMYALLTILAANSDTTYLRQLGLEYFQIAQLIQSALDAGLISYQDGNTFITFKGQEFLTRLRPHYPDRGAALWVRPRNDVAFDDIDQDLVYLPPSEWTDK
jgi:hypothetical protein